MTHAFARHSACVCVLEVDPVTMASWWVDLSVCDEAILREEGPIKRWLGRSQKAFFNKLSHSPANTQVP